MASAPRWPPASYQVEKWHDAIADPTLADVRGGSSERRYRPTAMEAAP